MLHKQYPSLEASIVKVRDYTCRRPFHMILEVSVQNPTSCSPEPTAVAISQTCRYEDSFNLVGDERPVFIRFELKQTVSTTGSESRDAQKPVFSSADFFDQDPVVRIFQASYEQIVKLINKDEKPLHQSLRYLAAYIFELLDQSSSQNKVEEVQVSLNDTRKKERLKCHLTRNEYNELADRNLFITKEELLTRAADHKVFVALGSNVGDRIAMLEAACAMMKDEGLHVKRTSSLYETKPMYFEKQDQFVNGVCQVWRSWDCTCTRRLLTLIDKH